MHLNDRILAIDDHVENLIILEELLAAHQLYRSLRRAAAKKRFAFARSFSQILCCSMS